MFARRRQRVLDAMGPDAVGLFVGARLVTRSNDTEYRFRQDSDFWYLTGFDHPDAVAILRTDGGPAFTLFVQPREPAAETWTGYRPGVEGAQADYGADSAYPISELRGMLPDLVKHAKRVYHVLGRADDLDKALIADLDDQRRKSRVGLDPASEIVDPRGIVHEMRLFKEPGEVALMREAQSITRDAHCQAARLAQPGNSERELEAVLDYTFRRRGATGPAYSTIVGGGANATVLHYIRNDQPLVDGDLVLIDAGAELGGYAADVTRTYPVGGRFDKTRRAVYEAVLASQLAALAASRPGATLESIHDTALRARVVWVVSLGLLEGTVDDLVSGGDFRPYYMHRTSHWLGLDVHDVGSYSRDGAPRPLEPGMVFTIEPGIYIPADAPDVPEALRGIGVRIEDDVLVTEDGIENLSAHIPKNPEAIEAWVND